MAAMRARSLPAALVVLVSSPLVAQGTSADYQRAAALGQRWQSKIVEFPRSIRWLDGGEALWFVLGHGEQRHYVRVKCSTGERTTGPSAEERGIDASETALEPLSAWTRSRRGGAETRIRLENTFESALHVRWVDPDGTSHDYGALEPGERRDQHTFAGHVWRLEFANGDVAGVFRAESDEARAVATADQRRISREGIGEPGP